MMLLFSMLGTVGIYYTAIYKKALPCAGFCCICLIVKNYENIICISPSFFICLIYSVLSFTILEILVFIGVIMRQLLKFSIVFCSVLFVGGQEAYASSFDYDVSASTQSLYGYADVSERFENSVPNNHFENISFYAFGEDKIISHYNKNKPDYFIIFTSLSDNNAFCNGYGANTCRWIEKNYNLKQIIKSEPLILIFEKI